MINYRIELKITDNHYTLFGLQPHGQRSELNQNEPHLLMIKYIEPADALH
jgi:hypothetical protein